jgi:hypothetical protein
VAEPCPTPSAGPSISERCGGRPRAGPLWRETCAETWRRLAFSYRSSVHHSLKFVKRQIVTTADYWGCLVAAAGSGSI